MNGKVGWIWVKNVCRVSSSVVGFDGEHGQFWRLSKIGTDVPRAGGGERVIESKGDEVALFNGACCRDMSAARLSIDVDVKSAVDVVEGGEREPSVST